MTTEKTKEKKAFKMPPLMVLIAIVIIIAMVMTWVIPAGVFDNNPDTGRLDPASFHTVEPTPVNPWQLLTTIYSGFSGAMSIIIVVLYSGSAMNILLHSGAVESVIDYLLYRMKDKSVTMGVPVLCIAISLLGGLAGGDHYIAFMPVGLMIASKMRLDRICALAIIYGAAWVGFGCFPKGVMQAQMLADVIPFSGFGVRLVMWFILTVFYTAYTMRYAMKIVKDPSASIMGPGWQDELPPEVDQKEVKLEARALLSVIALFATYTVYAYGVSNWKWAYPHLVAVQTIMFITIAILYRMPLEEVNKQFMIGARNVASVCIIIGMARVISVVLTAGQVIHTIVYYVSIPMGMVGKGFANIFILIFLLFFNLLVPSSSGMAAIVMPILTPLGDALGITRQAICSAFQYGDALTNMIAITSGVCVGFLGLANVEYNKWFKFEFPAIVIMSVIAAAAIYIQAAVGWTG